MPRQNPRYARPATCAGCSLNEIGFGFAIPSGPLGARLTFIGEALGYEEAIAGEPFMGSAGGTLTRILLRAGIMRSDVRIANIVSCQPPGDYLVGAPWEEHAIAMCRQYLQPVLASVPDNGVVVPLGATALTTILNLRGVAGVTVKDFHSCVSRVDRADGTGYWVVPSFHPSHLQRGAMNLMEVVTQDFRLAATIAASGFTRSPFQLVVDPHPDWFVRWVNDHLARLQADPTSVHLSCDTEFDEKSGGADESEVIVEAASSSPITRVNGGNDRLTGWTVPYRSPYKEHFERLIAGVQAAGSWIWAWNKYADLGHLQRAGHRIENYAWVDGMWLWKYLQSDIPRGLGFVAPMASDFGAWKHWGKQKELEGQYAAGDGLQNYRTCMWLLSAAHRTGYWDLFLRDWHERDVYVLRPAHELGTPVDRPALEVFHQELQGKLAGILGRLKETAAQGVLKPKLGYAKRPKGTPCPECANKCPKCGCDGYDGVCRNYGCEGNVTTAPVCPRCQSTRMIITPPLSILGKPKKGGGEAKSSYMLEGVRLVEREVEVEANCCATCGAEEVGATHQCSKPRAPKRRRGEPVLDVARPVAQLGKRAILRTRFFWQLPFNPDAPAQVLAYLSARGIDAPVEKKTRRATTNKKALANLAKQHQADPFFQLQLDWKAVQKVDSTYAVGSLTRLDADDRLHPEFLPKPSTFRDSAQNPNLQNVVADKAGPEGLASGFRRCVIARDGIPPGTSDDDYARWQQRWGGNHE